MADVLTQQQIDELLKGFSEQGAKAFDDIEDPNEKTAKPYDFKTSKKLTKEQIKVIDSIFENYSRVLSSYLTGLTRHYCKVEVFQIEEQRYYEFSNALPDYVMMSMINMGIQDEDVPETVGIMQVSNPITFTLMDILMGGSGAYTEVTRDFTEIEMGLMTNVLSKMVTTLKDPWGQYIDLLPVMTNVETNSRVMQAIPPDEIVLLIMLEIEIMDVKNTMSICFPATNLDVIMGKFSDRGMRSTKRLDTNKENERRTVILNTIKDTRLQINAVLCETKVDLYDILTLQVDDVIPLNMPIDKNINIKIGDNLWFDGKLGIMNNKKAVRIDNIYKELR